MGPPKFTLNEEKRIVNWLNIWRKNNPNELEWPLKELQKGAMVQNIQRFSQLALHGEKSLIILIFLYSWKAIVLRKFVIKYEHFRNERKGKEHPFTMSSAFVQNLQK